MKIPKTGPIAIVHTTNSVSRPLASAGVRPCAPTSHGTPQSSVNTIMENCVPMWPKKPSRVPGRCQTPRTAPRISRIDAPERRARRHRGRVAHHADARTATSALATAAAPNADGHPAPCSTHANGSAESTCPSWQRIVVTWMTSGTRRAGNHRGTSASTAVNTAASPRPTSTLASTADTTSGATASRN